MEIELYPNKNSKEINPSNKSIDLSLLNYKLNKILSSKISNNSTRYTIDKNPTNQEIFEKIYLYEQKKYLNNTINNNILLMLNNYINTIPIDLQKKQVFREEFLNIISTLLINELELAYMTIIIDKIGWENIYKEIRNYLFYIGLSVKKNTSYELSFQKEGGGIIYYTHDDILYKIENKYNKKFKDIFNNWITNSNIKELLQDINKDIKIIDERFKNLKSNDNKKAPNIFISYNEIVNKILQNNNKDIDIDIDTGLFSRINMNNNINNINLNNPINIQLDRIDNFSLQNTFLNNNQEISKNIPIKETRFNEQKMESFNPVGGMLDLKINSSYKPEESMYEVIDNIYKIPTFTLNK